MSINQGPRGEEKSIAAQIDPASRRQSNELSGEGDQSKPAGSDAKKKVGMPTSSPTPAYASTTNEHLKAYHGLALRGPRGREQNRRTAPHAFSEGGHVPGKWSRGLHYPGPGEWEVTTPNLEIL
ncbi:uncharacterized protein N7496_011371 [Penicillium cataractarum]|uniref:Uncharacterized protein n=1 Tax=Penicillium cataractarum TaxID=2100454 RepID=A0A9W9UVF0_9EURO|nr:uncharacterized protein N7496_011371 [Penicillium cataractarum]KAJ5358958.1 hypothetical protein N7496_011371 [Penicillium cataractarum]